MAWCGWCMEYPCECRSALVWLGDEWDVFCSVWYRIGCLMEGNKCPAT